MAYQGAYDGLCGMYSVANAFGECGVANGRRVFRLACRSMRHELTWPQGIWAGTDLDDMKRMINYCRKKTHSTNDFVVEYPFENNPPLSNNVYVDRLSEFFDDESFKCAIIGTSGHWYVVKKPRYTYVDSFAFDESGRIYTPKLLEEDLDHESLVLFKIAQEDQA